MHATDLKLFLTSFVNLEDFLFGASFTQRLFSVFGTQSARGRPYPPTGRAEIGTPKVLLNFSKLD